MPDSHRPQRLTALLAVVGIAAAVLLALPGSARADGETWHDGGCRINEGQTVIIDWRSTPDAVPSPAPQLIRCILLAEEADYPFETDLPLEAPLKAAGIDYELDLNSGLFTSINHVPTHLESKFAWNWSTGQLNPDESGNYWLGESAYSPEASVDSFVGITLTNKPNDASGLPAVSPEFDLPQPTEIPTVTDLPSPTPTEDGPGDSATPSVSASPSASLTPTQTATPTPSPTTSSEQSSTPTSTPSPTRRPTTRAPQPTYQPQTPFNPPLPPIDEPPPPPIPEEPISVPPQDVPGQATAAANPTPSRVWGREDVTRQGAESERSEKPAPWSRLVAVAGAVVIVGGLGTAFARGLKTSTPPMVEDE